jgi:hypothetical protein
MSGPSGHGSPYEGPFSAADWLPTGSGPGAVVSTGRVQPLDALATAVSLLLGLMAVLAVFVCVAVLRWSQADDDFSRGAISERELDDALYLFVTVVLLYLVGLVVTGVVFIVWQYRHARNAEALGGINGLRPGWAIGGWFIPVANFVLPALQLSQASQASDPSLSPGMPGRGGRASPHVIFWAIPFGLGHFLIGSWSSVFPGMGTNDADDAGSVRSRLAVGYLLLAGAALLGIVMVHSLTSRQKARSVRVTGVVSNLGDAGDPTVMLGPAPGPPGPGLAPPPGMVPFPSGPGGTYPRRAVWPWALGVAVVLFVVVVGVAFQGLRDDVTIDAGGRRTPPAATTEVGTIVRADLLRPGDCFNGLEVSSTQLSVGELRRLSCTLPHDAEVFVQTDLPDEPGVAFPGEDDVGRRASQMCEEEFASYVGVDYLDSRWEFVTFWPDAASWRNDERGVLCSLIDPRFDPIEGSLRDSKT